MKTFRRPKRLSYRAAGDGSIEHDLAVAVQQIDTLRGRLGGDALLGRRDVDEELGGIRELLQEARETTRLLAERERREIKHGQRSEAIQTTARRLMIERLDPGDRARLASVIETLRNLRREDDPTFADIVALAALASLDPDEA